MTRILFFGTPEFALPSLEKLAEEEDFSIAVISQPDKPVGRKKVMTPPPAALLAREKNLDLYQPEKLSADAVRELEPDLGIVVAYGKIIPKEILEIPKHGFINLHPSLLPELRGPSPLQYALLKGSDRTGLTIMQLDAGMDSGPVLAQEAVNISPDDDYPSLSKKCAQKGALLLAKTIRPFLRGEIRPRAQDESKATYSKMIRRQDGEIDLKKDDPTEIMKKLRAFAPWPGIYFKWENKRFKIRKARLEGGRLKIDEIQPEGKKPMEFSEFLKGNPNFSSLFP